MCFENGHIGILINVGKVSKWIIFFQRATSAVRNLVPLKTIISFCDSNLEIQHFKSSLPYWQTHTAPSTFIYQGHDHNLINRIAVLSLSFFSPTNLVVFLWIFTGLTLLYNILNSFWPMVNLGKNKQRPSNIGSTQVSTTY